MTYYDLVKKSVLVVSLVVNLVAGLAIDLVENLVVGLAALRSGLAAVSYLDGWIG